MRGNWGSLSKWGPSWSSFRRLSTSLALWPKKSCFSEVRASSRSGHSSLSWLKNGSSPNRLVKAACWDITSAVEDSSWWQPGSVVCRRLQGRRRTVVRDITPDFSPLYTPAVLIRPSLLAIYTPWAHCCLLACNSEVRNALQLIDRLKRAHGHILFGFVCMWSCSHYSAFSYFLSQLSLQCRFSANGANCNLLSKMIWYESETISFQIIQGTTIKVAINTKVL